MTWLDTLPKNLRDAADATISARDKALRAWYEGEISREKARNIIAECNKNIALIAKMAEVAA